jgi:enoyl-[acyl-carrier protein] reductase II
MQLAEKRLNELWARGKDFLGVRYAILGGAMTWVSERNLISAISNAGGFGVIASGAMAPPLLRTEIQETQTLTKKPFGVNLITIHPQLMDLIDVCVEEKMTHVVLAGGLPSAQAIIKLKDKGLKVICFAPAPVIAKKLIKLGVDALIIEGMEAGGHIGPVSTSVLAQEILPHIREIPVFVAGGIGRGEAIVSYLEMGAAGCQLGTRFVCTTECIAHPDFKKAFIRAQARDAIISSQLDPRFPVIPVRALSNQATKDFMVYQKELIKKVDRQEVDPKEAQLQIEHFWAGALRRAVIDGDTDRGSLMAGQSVGMVTKEQSTHEVIEELLTQAKLHLQTREGVKPGSIGLC